MKPWLGSKETEIEKAHRELLRALVIEMQNILLRRGVKTALIGGTALRLAYQLARRSKDIDLKVSRFVGGGEDLAVEATKSIEGWKARRGTIIEASKGLKGVILKNEKSGVMETTEIDLLEGAVNNWDTEGVNEDWLVTTNGIETYPLDVLGRLKLATVIGDRPRTEVKDVLDIAWFMGPHGYLIQDSDGKALGQWAKYARENAATGAEYKAQTGGKWTEIVDHIAQSNDRAGKTREQAKALAEMIREIHRRTGKAKLQTTVDREGRMHVVVQGDGRTKTTFGRIASTAVIALAMMETQGLEKKTIPELVLTLERERSAEMAKARTRRR